MGEEAPVYVVRKVRVAEHVAPGIQGRSGWQARHTLQGG